MYLFFSLMFLKYYWGGLTFVLPKLMYSQNPTFLWPREFLPCDPRRLVTLSPRVVHCSLKVNSCGSRKRGNKLGAFVFLRLFSGSSPFTHPQFSFLPSLPTLESVCSPKLGEMGMPRSWVKIQPAQKFFSSLIFHLDFLPACQQVFLVIVCL